MKRIITLFLVFYSLVSFAQCPLNVLADDLSKTNKEFKEFVNESSGFKAWQILEKEAPTLRTEISELSLVSKNLDAIEKAGGYTKWKGLHSEGSIFGNIVKNGNKIEYTNPSGKILKWTEQGANDIDNAITTAKNLDPLNTNNIGRITEAKVADFIKQEGKTVQGFGLTIKKADNSIVTDIDIITSNEIIEVKNSMAVWEKKPNQVTRFVNSSLEDFVNPHNKKAILYVEKPLSDLDKAKILNTIPTNVTLVNSLTELKTILK